jgi:uncharacterized membrane protein
LSRRASVALGAAGAAGFLLSCLLVAQGLRNSSLYSDVHVYAQYAGKMTSGAVPYRDFFDEYPPLAQPVFLLARVAGAAHYALAFKALMALCGIGAIACTVAILRALRASVARSVAAVTVVAAAPLLVFDRPLLAFGFLGAAVAAKFYPVAVLPVALLYVEGRLRRSALLTFAGVVALAHLPFLVLGPGGLKESYWLQAKRGLELNSLGGAFLLAFGDPKLGNEPPGSLNVLGGAADAIAVVSSVLVLVAIAAVAVAFARSRRDPSAVVLAAAAAVAGFVAFSKVFSAQYVDWLVPLAPLAGVAASGATVAILALTRAVFSHRAGIQADGDAVWLLLVRDTCVVFLTVLLLAAATRHRDVTRY